MTIEIRVEGLADIRENLKRLPERLQRKAIQAGLAKAAAPIAAAARAAAPVDTGRIRRAIYNKASKFSAPALQSRIVGIRYRKKIDGRAPFYWKFQEFGHRVGNKKTGYLQKKGRGAGHSGTVHVVPARPFLRPAFEANKARAVEIFRQVMAAEIVKVAQAAQARSLNRLRRASLGF